MENIIAGCIGALVPELIRIGKGPVDNVFSTSGYWVQLLAQIVVGAIVAYYINPKDVFEAFSLGFTGPQLATRLAAAPTPAAPVSPPKGGGPSRFDPRIWWSR